MARAWILAMCAHCTVTLTLEIKVMIHPWVMDNNFVKCNQDLTRVSETMT